MIKPISSRMHNVQDPIIPIVGKWTRENPGTVSLGQGVVWYPPPVEIANGIESFSNDARHHLYQPVHGIPELLAVIERKLEMDNHIQLGDNRRVVVTAGGNLAFSNAVFAIADPGDEFILSVPFYFNHEMAIAMASCKTVRVPSDAQYQLDLNAIEAAVTAKTKAVVTVSPGNPTGVVLDKQSLIDLNQLCRRKGIYHIHDEAYEYFHYGDSQQFSPASLPDSEAHTISLYSLSKSFGFAGWRIGYMVIPQVLFESVLKIQDTQLICPTVISQFAAVEAMRLGKTWIHQQQRPIQQSRALVMAALDDLAPLLSYPVSMGAFYFYLNVNTDISSLALCRKLIETHRVAVIPGRTFGSETGCYLRVAYGAMTPQTAAEGVGRLAAGLRAIVG